MRIAEDAKGVQIEKSKKAFSFTALRLDMSEATTNRGYEGVCKTSVVWGSVRVSITATVHNEESSESFLLHVTVSFTFSEADLLPENFMTSPPFPSETKHMMPELCR